MKRLLASMAGIALLVLAEGCVAPSAIEVTAEETSAAALVWPKPPAQARIRYIRSLSGPQDLGIAKPFFQRFLDALGGAGVDHFVRPTGVAAQGGTLYVADPGAQVVWILDSARGRYVKVDEVGATALVSPVAVAPGPDGAVFVADTALRKVFLLDRDGTLIRVVAEQHLERPAGLAYDFATQSLYVVDSATHRVAVFDARGQLVRTWGQGGNRSGEFNHPTHISVDASGSVRVTDALNFRIQTFDAEGRFLGTFGHSGDGSGDLSAPKGLATDRAGHVYVVDALFDAVQIFEPDGTYLLGFGEVGRQSGQFWLPGGIFIDAQDQIYVADAYNQRIQIFAVATGEAKELRR